MYDRNGINDIGIYDIQSMYGESAYGTEPFGVNLIQLVANITATNMTLSPGPYIQPGTIIVTVTWINNGNTAGTFEPAIKINDIRIGSGTNISLDIGELPHTEIFTISNLMKSTYTICPDPN